MQIDHKKVMFSGSLIASWQGPQHPIFLHSKTIPFSAYIFKKTFIYISNELHTYKPLKCTISGG